MKRVGEKDWGHLCRFGWLALQEAAGEDCRACSQRKGDQAVDWLAEVQTSSRRPPVQSRGASLGPSQSCFLAPGAMHLCAASFHFTKRQPGLEEALSTEYVQGKREERAEIIWGRLERGCGGGRMQ